MTNQSAVQLHTYTLTKDQAEQLIRDYVSQTEDSQFMRDYMTRFLLGARVSGLVQFAYDKALKDTESDRKAGENIKSYWINRTDGGVEP